MRRKTHGRRTEDIKQGEDGSYSYEGGYVRYADETPREQVVRRLGACLAAAALATLVPGLLPVKGLMGTLHITFAYVGQVVAVVSLAWGFVRLVRAGERIRVYVREETADRLPARAAVAALFAVMAAAADAVRVVMEGAPLDAPELAFLACGLVAAASLALFWAGVRRVRWEQA